jgi:hypothetical protein
MSLRPLLSTVTGRLTDEARRYVYEESVRYARWLPKATVNGRVPCPTCHSRLDQQALWPCPECAPYRRKKR